MGSKMSGVKVRFKACTKISKGTARDHHITTTTSRAGSAASFRAIQSVKYLMKTENNYGINSK